MSSDGRSGAVGEAEMTTAATLVAMRLGVRPSALESSAAKHPRRHNSSSSSPCGLPEAVWAEALTYLPGAGVIIMSVSKWMGSCYVKASGPLHTRLAPAMFCDTTPLALLALATPQLRPRHWARGLVKAAARAHRNDTVEALLQATGMRYSQALLVAALESGNESLAARMLEAYVGGDQRLVHYSALSAAAAAGNCHFLARCIAEDLRDWEDGSIATAAAKAGHWDALFRWEQSLQLGVNEQTACAAARAGNAQALQWATARRAPTASVIAAAVEGGHLDVALQLRRGGCPWDSSACAAALRTGQHGLFDALLAEGCPLGEDCYTEAARLGDTAVLTKLDTLACPANTASCKAAAQEGHTNVLEHLLAQRPATVDAHTLYDGAAHSGRLEPLEWTLSHGLAPTDAPQACEVAAARGHAHVLRWLHTHGGIITARAAKAAVDNGRLDALRACHEHDVPLTERLALGAARHGCPDVLQYVLSSGCEVGRVELLRSVLGGAELGCLAVAEAHLGDLSGDYVDPLLLEAAVHSCDLRCIEHVLSKLEAAGTAPTAVAASTCALAAGYGNLGALQLLRAYNCPWGATTCAEAAVGGHFEVLKWARASGCEWDEATCEEAAAANHLHMLQWARRAEQTGGACPWGVSTTEAAAFHTDNILLRWAVKHGCPTDESVCLAACQWGNLAGLQWLREELRCPWDWEECRNTAEFEQHGDIVAWIDNNH